MALLILLETNVLHRFLGVQQYALSEGRQGEQAAAVRLQKLRLQDGGRQLLHLRQQNYARN